MKDKVREVRAAGEKVDFSALLSQSVGWMTAGIPFLLHAGWTLRNLRRTAGEGALPRFTNMLGADLMEWVDTATALFVRPGTVVPVASFAAAWILVWLGLSIHSALRDHEDVLDGVIIFLNHVIAAVLMLLVVTPCLWILFGGWGPSISAFAAPLVPLFITIVLNRRAFGPLE